MRFILLTLEYPPFKGGVADYYYKLVKHAPKEHEVLVLHNNKGQLLGKGPIKWLKALKALRTKLVEKNSKLNIIVGQILPLGTVAWALSYLYKFKYTVVLHGMDIEYAKKYKRKNWLARKILEKASSIVCNSNYVAGLAKSFLGEKHYDKIKTVNPGVELANNEYRVASNVEPVTNMSATRYSLSVTRKNVTRKNNIILFSLGRLVKRKGFDQVIKAMPDIVAEVPGLEYYIAGAGEDESFLQAEKSKLSPNIREKIHFLGQLDEAEKWQYLRECDIFIMPNREIAGDVEGFGIVFLEASLAGKPVIGGRSGGTEDAIDDDESGLLVDGESIDEITDAVILLARNIDKRIRMGDYGMKRAISCFRWEDKARRFFEYTIEN